MFPNYMERQFELTESEQRLMGHRGPYSFNEADTFLMELIQKREYLKARRQLVDRVVPLGSDPYEDLIGCFDGLQASVSDMTRQVGAAMMEGYLCVEDGTTHYANIGIEAIETFLDVTV